MTRRWTKEQIINDSLRRAGKTRPLTEQDKRDRAVLSVMKDMPLKPGQMLLLGPKSVAILSGQVEFNGNLPDKLVLERDEWRPGSQIQR